MKPHEERVVLEKKELDEKISKLVPFISGEIFMNLEKLDRDLLLIQLDTMQFYSKILGQRINRF